MPMQSFCIILQKTIKSKNIIFSNNRNDYPLFSPKYYHEDFLHESMTIHHTIFYMMHKHNSSTTIDQWVKHKYKIFDIHIVNNILISNVLRDKLFDIFFKSQKVYNGFAKLANIYRYKKYKTVISDDLTLNPLDEKNPYTFVLLQNNCKYLFSIRDLINVVETSLLNNTRFFSEPISPKNPYNNMKLNDSSLYNIYFKKKETLLGSQLFDMYYLSNFSLEKFRLDNEVFLRDITIKNYTYKSPPNILRSSIMQMLNSNSFTKKLKIDKDFPNDLLADIFRPFLYNYLLIYYNFIGVEKSHVFDIQLNDKLCSFYNYNPNFGRKYIQKTTIFGKIEQNIFMNSNHLNFYNKKIINNLIDDTCLYVLELDGVDTDNILHNQNQRNSSNRNSLFILSRPLNNTIREPQRPTETYTQSSSRTQSPTNDTPNASPTGSPSADQINFSFLSVIDLYNEINDELSDNTLSETNEDVSVS